MPTANCDEPIDQSAPTQMTSEYEGGPLRRALLAQQAPMLHPFPLGSLAESFQQLAESSLGTTAAAGHGQLSAASLSATLPVITTILSADTVPLIAPGALPSLAAAPYAPVECSAPASASHTLEVASSVAPLQHAAPDFELSGSMPDLVTPQPEQSASEPEGATVQLAATATQKRSHPPLQVAAAVAASPPFDTPRGRAAIITQVHKYMYMERHV